MGWNNQAAEDIKRMWLEDGMSASQIARYIAATYDTHCTRNSIVGLAHRRGWHRSITAGTRPKRQPLPKQVVERIRSFKAEPPPPVTLNPMTLEDGSPITMENVKDGMCRWGHGDPTKPDFHFCAHPVVKNRSWCAHHMPKVFDKHRTDETNARYRARQESQRPDWNRSTSHGHHYSASLGNNAA